MSIRCIYWDKDARCVRLTTLPPSCAVFMKSGNLNFLEPSGSLQACNGTALPFTLSVELQQLRREDRCSHPSSVENNNSRNNASALSHMVLIASQRQIFFASIFFWSQVACPLRTLRYSTLFHFVLSSVWVSFFHLLLYL